MRTIERTGQFKRDYKRERKGPHQATLEDELIHIVLTLANDQALPEKHHDHALVETGRIIGIATSGRTW